MDIIAAHRQGLIEKLEEEAVVLAGRPREFGQRAIVLHHLYDHSRGSHLWALAEARRELRIARAIDRLRQRLKRWGWLLSRRESAELALAELAETLGEASRMRCVTAYVAYRLSGTAPLKEQAADKLSPELLDALQRSHSARRSGEALPADIGSKLLDLSEELVASVGDTDATRSAWASIDATGLRRAARRLLGKAAGDRGLARDCKRGWGRIERELRNDAALPASFRANPAQHFYALQNVLAERRRQQWREACDREPDAFELAA